MTDKDLLNAFANIPGILRKELTGLTHDQLTQRMAPGTWSIHEVALHVADADAALVMRLKRIIAEDRPHYDNWDESAFIATLRYDLQSADDAVTGIEIAHRQLHKVLGALPPTWFDRVGVQSRDGEQTARDVLHKSVWHIEHHLKFVVEKKTTLGLVRA